MSIRVRDVCLFGLGIVLSAACGEGGESEAEKLAAAGSGDTAAAATCQEEFPVGELCACSVSFDWSALGVEPASVTAYVVDLGREDAVDAVCDEVLTQGQVLDAWAWPETRGVPPSDSFDLSPHDGRTLVVVAMDEAGLILGRRAFGIASTATGDVAAL